MFLDININHLLPNTVRVMVCKIDERVREKEITLFEAIPTTGRVTNESYWKQYQQQQLEGFGSHLLHCHRPWIAQIHRNKYIHSNQSVLGTWHC